MTDTTATITATTAAADDIVAATIPGNAPGDHADDLGDDDRRWIETITTSFDQRSHAARHALVEAVLVHHGSMPLLAPTA